MTTSRLSLITALFLCLVIIAFPAWAGVVGPGRVDAASTAATTASPQPLANLPTDFEDTQLINGLNQPVGFDFLPDGRILFVEQRTAAIRMLVNGSLGDNDPLVTVPQVNSSGNEQGLLGITVDPGWPARPYIYVYYSHSGTSTNYLSMYECGGDLDNPDSGNLSIMAGSLYHLLTDIPDNASNHNGGTVRFGIDGMLYVSMGDDANQCAAQETDDLRGMILRLDISSMPGSGGGPPAKSAITPSDNPFSGDANTNLVFCHGLRNPFRFNVDPQSGDLFIGDVGLNNFEEMNQCSGGENFGWPFREAEMIREPSGCEEPGGPGGSTYDGPIQYYDRSGFSASIISGGLYRPANYPLDASFPPEYNGDCFYIEYYEGWMRRITYRDGAWHPADPVDGQPSNENWATGLQFASDFLRGPDGALYYVKQFGGGGGGSGGAIQRIAFTGTPVAAPRLITGPGPGSNNQPLVRVFDPANTSAHLSEWSAYGVPRYGVNVAAGDLDGDGIDEVLTGPGPGTVFGPHVRAFDGAGNPVPGISFLAYGTNKYGVNVTCGDLDNDGSDEIITGAGPGAVFGPHVRGWDVSGGSVSPIPGISYFAYGTRKWGVNVACGDLDGDGRDEIITGAGPGTVFGPHVRGWMVDAGGGGISPMPSVSFLAYGTHKYGVNVACGDIDGDGRDEIITGAGPGQVFGSHVRAWDYEDGSIQAMSGVNFFAYQGSQYGAVVAAGDLDWDGDDEIFTMPGPDPALGAQVRAYDVVGGNSSPISGIDFDAYADHGLSHGGNVALGVGY